MTPNTYPVWSANWFYDFKLSMYFTYSSAQNFVRTITQGVSLSDKRTLTGNYRRMVTETTGVKAVVFAKFGLFCRKRFETADAVTHSSRLPLFIRKCAMGVNAAMRLSRWRSFLRVVTEQVQAALNKTERRDVFRTCADAAHVSIASARTLLMHIRNVRDGLKAVDTQAVTMVHVRSVPDTASVKEYTSHLGAFFRGLFVTAGNVGEVTHSAEYRRCPVDTVQADGKTSRGLLFFVHIITRLFVRDYLLRRFLKARKDLVLKSKINREIVLDSRIV